MPSTFLSKGHYAASLQCDRRGWQQVRAPERAAPADAGQLERLRQGREVGKLAWALFPGGREVSAHSFEAACSETRALLEHGGPLFEAAFEVEDLRVRVDVLERLADGRFSLSEIKSSTALRDEHLDDASFQYWALTRAGIEVSKVEIITLAADYEAGALTIDPRALLARREVTDDVRFLAADLDEHMAEVRQRLAAADPFSVAGRQCVRPHRCEFWDYCHRGLPPDSLANLPRLSDSMRAELDDAGVERIADIPDETSLNPVQQRVRTALKRGQVIAEEDLVERLAPLRALENSVYYLDFESWAPAIPRFARVRPYEPLPFQWSCHERTPRGDLRHREFLISDAGDPREAFSRSLIRQLAHTTGPIAVYSNFEASVLGILAERLPDLREPLDAIRRRLFDLLVLVRESVYHPAFAGSFSLKRVGPALSPGFSYADLDGISEGGAAAAAGRTLMLEEQDPAARDALRASLRAYCERDTLALVELHAALDKLANQVPV